MFRVFIILLIPFYIFASEVSDIYRIGTATIKINDNSVDGTLLGYKRHIVNDNITFGADINYIIVENNIYGIDDTVEGMLHLGTMATDALELYGSYGFAIEGSENGFGWGLGAVYAFNETISVTYEYRSFSLDTYKLKSASLGLLISF